MLDDIIMLTFRIKNEVFFSPPEIKSNELITIYNGL